MPVPGYEHRTFMCSACGDIERRLVFARDIGQSPTEPVSVHTAPPISPAPTDQQERIAASGILRRVSAKLRCKLVSVRPAPPTALRPAEPVPVNTTAHSSVPSEAINDLDGLEALLRRAMEKCPGSTRRSQPTESLTDEGPGTLASSASVYSVPPTSVSSEPDKNLDECEALLRRAIEMVRGPTRSSQITSVTEARSKTPSKLVSSMRAERPTASRIVVQIHHDPQKAKYVAQDTTSGLRILRHQDSARLRAMCDRMGWQVIEDGALKVSTGQV